MPVTIQITIAGKYPFLARLEDSPATQALLDLLPLQLDMIELNQNEKYQDLPRSLPTRSSVPERIRCGDLMLYGTRTLVLFYKDFPTTYPYTRLGTITDTKGLREALGKGNVEVKLEK